MFHLLPWTILLGILIGNCGFWLFCFNRINATGLARKHTKKIEKLFILLCFLIPTSIAIFEWNPISAWFMGADPAWWPRQAPLLRGYGAWCVASALVLGPWWLESRGWMIPPKHLLRTSSRDYQVHQSIPGGSPADRFTAFLNWLPGNQITDLQVSQKELLLPRKILGVEGFKILHLSDLHFTGQYRTEHYQFVFERSLELEPDLIVITGDIIDYDKCLPWIEPLLGQLTAPHGCTYVLGNHDKRLSDVSELTRRLAGLGLFDLGISDQTLTLASGAKIELTGNERPWFERHSLQKQSIQKHSFQKHHNGMAKSVDDTNLLRLGLSHSPDQIHWARSNKLDLLLAGHTHGGQVRFPGIGPIVAPSRYGSRYASGVFYLRPTLMHVSRGIAGTHPLRWRCAPEVSLLTLRNSSQA